MRKYILTIPTAKGIVTFGFNGQDQLIFYCNESEMSEKQLKWMWEKLPFTSEILQSLARVVKGNLEEVPLDLTFDSFYRPYPNKRNKHRAIPLFDRLNDEQKAKCILAVKPYVSYLERARIAAMLPENFIKREEYLNNFNAL